MTEPQENPIEEEQEAQAGPTELELLKGRADMMGLKYHPNIGAKTLAEKIKNFQAQLKKTAAKEEREALRAQAALDAQQQAAQPTATVTPITETVSQKNARLRRDAARLVRVRVACMNPNKKDWEGEIYTISNSVVGTHRKYVPFNAEKGWHVPQIIYKHMKERKCQVFYTVKGPRGEKIRKGKLIPELAIEVLDPLTPEEIADLAQQQAMSGSIE